MADRVFRFRMLSGMPAGTARSMMGVNCVNRLHA